MRFATLLISSLIATTGAMFLSFGCGGGGTGGSTNSTGTGGGSTNSTSSGAGAGSTGTGMGGSTSGTGGMSSSSGTAGAGTGTSSSGTSSGIHPIAPCQAQVYACGDGIDNDGDGLIDSDDPDCLGPCDNSEDSYYPNIPGQNSAPCKADCYFDNDTGPGNDDCYWDHGCDPHEVAPNYYPESINGAACTYNPNTNISGTNKTCAELYQAQSQTCHDICGPLTPNGCDCFGCCELPAGTGKYVYLGSINPNNEKCDIANINNPDRCQPCLPVAACLNTCGTCELCLGKTELPPECFPDGGVPDGGSSSSSTSSTSTSTSSSSSSSSGGQQCSDGVTPCGLPGQLPCPSGYYCITGCCQKIPN